MNHNIRIALLPLAFAFAFALALPALAQDSPPAMTPEQMAMMEAYQKAGTPGAAHAALAKMAGTYDLEIRSWEAPGAPPAIDKGTATRKMILGGRVLVEEATASMHGQPFNGMGMHGYDNVTGRHWSTWSDSMGTGLMVSEGECDADYTCTFKGSWNDPVTRGRINARMTTRWTNAETEVFEMFTPAPDGSEMKMMEITYTKRAE